MRDEHKDISKLKGNKKTELNKREKNVCINF